MGDETKFSDLSGLIDAVENKVARCALRCVLAQLNRNVGAAFLKPPEGCHWALHPIDFEYNKDTGHVEISISADLRLH